MWIISFQGKPSYWLVGDATYTIGRKDTDMVILDDTSISRVHLSIEVGCSPVCRAAASDPHAFPTALLKLKDTSKYGSTVQFMDATGNVPSDAPVVLKRDEVLAVPAGVKQFVLTLGSHGVQFVVSWQPSIVCISGVDDDCTTKLENRLSRCGCLTTTNVADCDILLTSRIEPTQDIVLALCRAVPIVSIQYFDAIIFRSNAKVPLPDPANAAFRPPLDAFWAQLAVGGDRAGPVEDLGQLFQPRRERRFLLSDLTFVCVQPALFREVSVYIQAAHGKALLDESLNEAAILDGSGGGKRAAAARGAILAAFSHRHQRHVVLFTTADTLPFDAFPDVVTRECALPLLDYTVLLRTIFEAKRVVLESAVGRRNSSAGLDGESDHRHRPHQINGIEILTRCTTEGTMDSHAPSSPQRRTMQCLFDEEADPGAARGGDGRRVDEHRAVDSDSVHCHATAKRLRSSSGRLNESSKPTSPIPPHPVWRSRSEIQMDADPGESRSEQSKPIHDDESKVDGADEDMIVKSVVFPPYPCFRQYRRAVRGTSERLDFQHEKGKAFTKQTLVVSVRCVDYEPARNFAAEALVSGAAQIDCPNLFNEAVAQVGELAFNKFDTAAANRTERKRSTAPVAGGTTGARRQPGRPRGRDPPQPRDPAGLRDTDLAAAAAPPARVVPPGPLAILDAQDSDSYAAMLLGGVAVPASKRASTAAHLHHNPVDIFAVDALF